MERTDQTPEMAALDILKAKIKKHISTFDVIIFFSTLGLSLLVHMYMFTHKFINHDDVGGLYSGNGFGLSSGRFLLSPVTKAAGSFSGSWFNGIIGCVFLAVAVVFVIRIYKIRHYIPALLCAFCMISFPTIASTYAYMFCSYQYLLALALSAVGAYLIRKEKILPIVLGSVFIMLGMGCYQAYFGLTAILLVLVLIMDVCKGRFSGNVKGFILVSAEYVAGLALGMILYFVVLKICLYATGTELTSYQGISSMGKVTISELYQRIKMAYKTFFEYPNQERFTRFFPYLVWGSWVLDLAAVGYSFVKRCLYKNWTNILLIALLFAVTPLAASMVYVMTDSVHQVMTYSFVITLIAPAIIADSFPMSLKGSQKPSRIAVSFVLILLVFQCCFSYEFALITNRAYFCMDMTYENTYAFFVNMTTRIESFDGWKPDQKVALIGTATSGTTVPDVHMTGVFTGNSALNIYTRQWYIRYFLGKQYSYADDATASAIRDSDAFQAMPKYPADGSVAMIDDVLVVKFGNW